MVLGCKSVLWRCFFILKTKKTQRHVFALTATSAMIALSVVLCRYLGFSPENTPFRFEIGFLPIAFVAYLFGPLYSSAAFLIADIIGSLLGGYAPNPWISGCQFLFGLIMGFAFYKKKPSVLRISICFSFIAVAIEFIAKSPIFVFLYGWEWGFTLWSRALNAIANLPIRIILFYLTIKVTKGQLDMITKKNDFKNYANSFQAVTVPGLERIGALCRLLGNPEDKLRCIHIAGTNGKGSVSANMAAILEEAGFKVGKFISPNLIRVNERISINGKDISDEELSEVLGRIEPLCDSAEFSRIGTPTQFEIWCAAAFLYFSERECDYVVLEVGLGGEFDATNIIKRNEAAIITRLGIDHTQYLGATPEKIASAKAGILKKDSTTGKVITVRQEPSSLAVIEKRASELGLTLEIAEPTPLYKEGCREHFSIADISDIACGIAGYHQIENASLAVLCAKALGIDDGAILRGVARAKNPARFELIRENPTVIYDGGHNENGIAALVSSLDRYFGSRKKTVIFAAMGDKDIKESLDMLSANETEFIFTTVKDNPRALSAKALEEKAAALGHGGEYYEDIKEAYERALAKGELVVICGSLYLYKDFSEMLLAL